MLDDAQLEEHIKELIIDICALLCERGYEVVPVGAMMRLVGVRSDRAQLHDNEYLALDDDFKLLIESRKSPEIIQAPDGVTLH